MGTLELFTNVQPVSSSRCSGCRQLQDRRTQDHTDRLLSIAIMLLFFKSQSDFLFSDRIQQLHISSLANTSGVPAYTD